MLLFLLGSGYDDESDLTSEDRKKLDDTYQLVIDAMPGIMFRLERGTDMGHTINRVISFLTGIYYYALIINGIVDTDMFYWELGDTEHCTDCVTEAGKGEMPGSYWKERALAGIYPKSPNLLCTGLNCQCNMRSA